MPRWWVQNPVLGENFPVSQVQEKRNDPNDPNVFCAVGLVAIAAIFVAPLAVGIGSGSLDRLPCAGRVIAGLVAYLWVGFAAMFGTWGLIDLYYLLARRVANVMRRMSGRPLRILIGIMERAVFTTLGIYLLQAENTLPALAAIISGYAIVKYHVGTGEISQDSATGPEQARAQGSIHALWGTVLSLGFALFAAHAFWIIVKVSC